MKYQRRHDVADAFRWIVGNLLDAPGWLKDVIKDGEPHFHSVSGGELMLGLQTPHGELHATVGDYILQHSDGRILVYPPDILEASWEKVAEARRRPTHVLVDFGNDHKIDIDVANILIPAGECLRVTCGEHGPIAGSAKYDELECTNGS